MIKRQNKKIYKFLFILLSILAIAVLVCILKKYMDSKRAENENKETLEVFSRIDDRQIDENTKIKLNGYDVIGKIEIPKINIEYPIIAIENPSPDETKIPLKFSIVRYWGGEVNEYGNLSIAGHNKYDGTMFGKINRLEIYDEVKLTDLAKKTISYKVCSKFVTDPNDISVLESTSEAQREVTLITCTKGNKKRLILKAKEKI